MTDKKLYVYLIWQTEVCGYDTFDSAVVIAESEDAARDIHPSEFTANYSVAVNAENDYERWDYQYASWASHPDHVVVELIGEATPGIDRVVVCASFNAG